MLNDLAALYASEPAWFAGSLFLLGLVVGSFLNVVIYRLPIILERDWRSQATDLLRPVGAATPAAAPLERFTLSSPRSACPSARRPSRPCRTFRW